MVDTTVLKAEIEQRNRAFMKAAQAGDAAALTALYTDDAWLLPPDSDMLRGKSDIEAFWRSRLEGIAAVDLATVEVAAIGADAAREIGTASITVKGSPPQHVAGKYVVVWRRVGGEWRLETDIWNVTG